VARLYQKRGVWYAWGWTATGKRWVKTTRQRERRAAVIVARKLERDYVGAEDSAAHPSATLGEAVTALLAFQKKSARAPSTLVSTRVKLGHFVRIFGESFDIAGFFPPAGSRVASEYVEKRIAEGAKRSTIFLEVTVLKSALRNAARAGRWRGDTRAIEVPELRGAMRPRRSWALPDVLHKVIAATPPQWREHVETWSALGIRHMELYRIEAHDIDARGDRVHVRGTKTESADRWVPMPPRIRKILLRRAKATPTGPLFRHWKRASNDLPAVCKKAGVQRLMVSDLRRTFASHAISENVSSSVLKEILGHTTTKQIDVVYGHASEAARRDAVLAVARGVARTASRGGTKGTKGTGRRKKTR
jgi:integrase